MTNSDLILELLDDISPNAYCDDCLSSELDIQPRQQVNQIGHKLEKAGKIERKRGVCSYCKKIKTINQMIEGILPSDSSHGSRAMRETQADDNIAAITPALQPFDIEHARTEVVRICHEIWESYEPTSPSHSISAVINTLRNANLLPSHQANMMLTLCNLRNVYVYENIKLGEREVIIAENAMSIVRDWFSKMKL